MIDILIGAVVGILLGAFLMAWWLEGRVRFAVDATNRANETLHQAITMADRAASMTERSSRVLKAAEDLTLASTQAVGSARLREWAAEEGQG